MMLLGLKGIIILKKDLGYYIISVYIAPAKSKDRLLDTISDAEIIQNIYRDLDKVFESASSKITGYDIERFPYGYTVMSKGAYGRLLQLDKLNHGSLILAGDYMVYPTFEGVIQSGYLAAQRIQDN
ncbi:hypothetical protein AZF37_00655 [endosymbiont 'TC1' of Trimyema compressum]|uniref:FAD-dependent oxidoreductase n=1 Tax=endosymbiont 'TC1' of Trimyema compressum TaxID=243899 RepID=UPI0007F0565A|nr:FAD-dependent oxidoreductase [endosymbiont 'TC1' of Trimyema compressum]AMP19883.1 hypothetical protein AZF37_00655 [endosymbiont 'TC1' of Trimyema compressum]